MHQRVIHLPLCQISNYCQTHQRDCKIYDLHMSQPAGSIHRMELVYNLIQSDIRENLGYHLAHVLQKII